MLLNKGTKDLQAGRSIDALLEDLAPHVLCTRFHQGQASDLTKRWKRQVRQYLDSMVASTPSPRPIERSSRIVSSQTIDANTERIALLEQRLLEAMEKVRRLENAQQGLTIMANPPSSSQDREPSVIVRSTSAETASSSNTPPLNHVYTTERRESTGPVGQPAITVPRPTQLQVSRETMAGSALSPRPATPPLVVRPSSSNERENGQEITSQPNRRQVEGECGICLCDFQLSQQDVDEDEEENSAHSDGNECDEEDDDDDDDDDEYDEQEHQDEELVWCKARCGVNFHKRCIDQWLETDHAPTCPACRSNWKH
jgi:hypothetical protein